MKFRQHVRISIEVVIETDYAPSSREEWVVAKTIQTAALRTKMPKGARVVQTSWAIDALKTLKLEEVQ